MVFQILQENSLHLNGNKCKFAQECVEYLGHVISAEGVGADSEKLKAMIKYPHQQTFENCGGSSD